MLVLDSFIAAGRRDEGERGWLVPSSLRADARLAQLTLMAILTASVHSFRTGKLRTRLGGGTLLSCGSASSACSKVHVVKCM